MATTGISMDVHRQQACNVQRRQEDGNPSFSVFVRVLIDRHLKACGWVQEPGGSWVHDELLPNGTRGVR